MLINELWSLALQAANWFFLGLLYLVLFIAVWVARRELQQHIDGPKRKQPAVAAPGHLRVLAAGSDPNLTVGGLFALGHETTIGAVQDNDFILADEYVSDQHARLFWDGVDWWIEDLGSRNGVSLNGRPIPPRRPQRVPLAAVIEIGEAQFKLLE